MTRETKETKGSTQSNVRGISKLDPKQKGYKVFLTKDNLRGVYENTILVALSEETVAVFIARKGLKKVGPDSFTAYVNSDGDIAVANKENKDEVVPAKEFLETAIELDYKVVKSDIFEVLF